MCVKSSNWNAIASTESATINLTKEFEKIDPTHCLNTESRGRLIGLFACVYYWWANVRHLNAVMKVMTTNGFHHDMLSWHQIIYAQEDFQHCEMFWFVTAKKKRIPCWSYAQIHCSLFVNSVDSKENSIIQFAYIGLMKTNVGNLSDQEMKSDRAKFKCKFETSYKLPGAKI